MNDALISCNALYSFSLHLLTSSTRPDRSHVSFFGFLWYDPTRILTQSTSFVHWQVLNPLYYLNQWLLTEEDAYRGRVNKFPWWREPLRALQHRKFDQ